MSFQAQQLSIPGLVLLSLPQSSDERGNFTKFIHAKAFSELELRSDFKEAYRTYSTKGVIRGMHFQAPPYDHAKLVECLLGSVRDVVVDLREASPTFKSFVVTELSDKGAKALYIPTGCAHGFAVDSKDALLEYHVTSEYVPNADTGIRYDSFGYDWGIDNPVVSNRDRSLPHLIQAIERPVFRTVIA